MRIEKILVAVWIVLMVCVMALTFTFGCEECVLTDDGFHGCLGSVDTGHFGCVPADDGSNCSVSGNCGLKSTL